MTNQEILRAMKADPEMAARVKLICQPRPTVTATCPQDVLPLLNHYFDGRDHEVMVVIALNRRQRCIDHAIISRGNDCFTVVCSRQIFRWALTRGKPTGSIILAHNHPSGDPTPSSQDVDVTRAVVRAGGILGVQLADHIVWGSPTSWISLKAQGVI